MAKKLSDEQFFAILRENGGLFARTSRAIKKEFKIDFIHDNKIRSLSK